MISRWSHQIQDFTLEVLFFIYIYIFLFVVNFVIH